MNTYEGTCKIPMICDGLDIATFAKVIIA